MSPETCEIVKNKEPNGNPNMSERLSEILQILESRDSCGKGPLCDDSYIPFDNFGEDGRYFERCTVCDHTHLGGRNNIKSSQHKTNFWTPPSKPQLWPPPKKKLDAPHRLGESARIDPNTPLWGRRDQEEGEECNGPLLATLTGRTCLALTHALAELLWAQAVKVFNLEHIETNSLNTRMTTCIHWLDSVGAAHAAGCDHTGTCRQAFPEHSKTTRFWPKVLSSGSGSAL